MANQKRMTIRQRILQFFYPILVRLGKLNKSKQMVKADKSTNATQSIYNLEAVLNNQQLLKFEALKGKKVLLVNTASNCGYTPQYAELQKLHQQYKNKLMIIGFPANDFKEQEKGSDDEIARFCQVNYGVDFPIAKKSTVVASADQNPVFKWLTHKNLNGWNDQQPVWNFSKYLINEKGQLTHVFKPSVSPLSKEVIEAIEN